MSERTINDNVALNQLTRLWQFDRKSQRDTLWGFLLAIAGLGILEDDDLSLLISVYFGRCSMEIKPTSPALAVALSGSDSFVRFNPSDIAALAG